MLRSLMIPLTLVCLHSLLEIPQAKCQVELGMMPDAFDDQYIGCEEEMDRHAPDLLKKEKSNSSLFSTAWENSRKKWQSVKTKISLYLPPDFTDEHGRAIMTYTDKEFSWMLNQAMRENGKSQADYMDNFHFKAFHYYLTRALRLLNGNCVLTYKMEVFRGVSGIRFKHKGPGLMRFGQFTSSSLKKEVAEKFGTDSFFTIRTCFGRDIRAFSHSPEEEEVLIPFNEKFNVFKGKGNNSFVLRSTNRTCSYFNCAYLGGKKNLDCVDDADEKETSCLHWFEKDLPTVSKGRAENNPTRQTCHTQGNHMRNKCG